MGLLGGHPRNYRQSTKKWGGGIRGWPLKAKKMGIIQNTPSFLIHFLHKRKKRRRKKGKKGIKKEGIVGF